MSPVILPRHRAEDSRRGAADVIIELPKLKDDRYSSRLDREAQPSGPVVPSSSARFLSAVADIKTKKGRKEGGGGHLKRRSRPRQRTTFAVADNWTVGMERGERGGKERKKIKIVETTGSGGVDDTLSLSPPLPCRLLGHPLTHPSPLPSTPYPLFLSRARAPVSRLLSESSKVKQSETLSGVERTFNNATKARIRGCLLCHAIATGDGT